MQTDFSALLPSPLLPLLNASDIEEVMINPDGTVWIERAGHLIAANILL